MGDHAWACFTYQQSAEMALKAGLEEAQRDHTGHYLPGLLQELCQARGVDAHEKIMTAARRLTRLYIPTRYPDAIGGGVPSEAYTAEDSEQAHEDAQTILEFVSPEQADGG